MAVGNRRDRDRRRKRRRDDPAFRAREAAEAAAYRMRKSGGPFESLWCERGEHYWHRIRRPGEKPKTCPTCRSKQKLWCPLCQAHWMRPRGTMGPKPKSCPAHRTEARRIADTAEQRKRRAETRSPIQRLTCKACGKKWKRPRPAKPCGAPHRCPECR